MNIACLWPAWVVFTAMTLNSYTRKTNNWSMRTVALCSWSRCETCTPSRNVGKCGRRKSVTLNVKTFTLTFPAAEIAMFIAMNTSLELMIWRRKKHRNCSGVLSDNTFARAKELTVYPRATDRTDPLNFSSSEPELTQSRVQSLWGDDDVHDSAQRRNVSNSLS